VRPAGGRAGAGGPAGRGRRRAGRVVPGHPTPKCAPRGAAQVLEGLLAEDDGVPDVWYLAGLCAHAGGDFEAALDAAAAGERLLRGGGGGAERGKPGEEAAPDSLAADFAELRVRCATSLPAGRRQW